MKKYLYVLMIGLVVGCSSNVAPTETPSNETETKDDTTYIDLNNIPSEYITKETESHEDVSDENKNVENTIINLTQPGTYEFSGTIDNGQIRVNSEGKVNVILNNVNITNKTAPAIIFAKGEDSQLTLKKTNLMTGSHVAEYTNEKGEVIDYDGAISSDVSFSIEGDGSLLINADKEGIESKKHLTIKSGILEINARDDAINASEDNESIITINGGVILANSTLGKEGDGIDSNGSIVINGGTIIARANETSMDSGLDSDLGITIKGGTIVATGNMYDEITQESKNLMHLVFDQPVAKNTPIIITDENDTPILGYTSPVSFSQITFASSKLTNGSYKVYVGGSLEGDSVYGLVENITEYTLGEQVGFTGNEAQSMGGRPGQTPSQNNSTPNTLFSLEENNFIFSGVQ